MPAQSAAEALVERLQRGSFALVSSSGVVLGSISKGPGPLEVVSEEALAATARSAHLDAKQAAAAWSFFADEDHAALATLPIIKGLLTASATPQAREALWGELASLAQAFAKGNKTGTRAKSLLGLFEANRSVLRPLLQDLSETQGACDEMIALMQASRVFGDDLEEGVAWVSEHIPAAVARYIEREREARRAVRWEYPAFESMMRWKAAHLAPGGKKPPRTLADLNASGAAFITVFNALHSLDEGFREVILDGLGPKELFNAVVAGERELYKLGTSGYRGFLHDIILRGIKESGSFEAFLAQAAPKEFGEEALQAAPRRGMAFLRVASSFGLLESVLDTVHDRDRFVQEAIASLGDEATFEANSTVVLDLLTARTKSSKIRAFQTALLERLYDRYRTERRLALRRVYGSMLSVYQTITADRRDLAIDSAFPLDEAAFVIPFDRLFSRNADGGFTHRMFMRMDDNDDALETAQAFRALIENLDGSVRAEPAYAVYTVTAPGRTVEIYVNNPSATGLRDGIPALTAALRGLRVETVIGRGHTSIIAPLQEDSRRVLGDRVKGVAAVLVGSCGGDASVRDLISTFGYIPFFTTKSTGRHVINNAIIKSYIQALLKLAPGERLSVAQVLSRATGRFQDDDDLRGDASLYQVNMATVFTARLFDAYVRQTAATGPRLAQD